MSSNYTASDILTAIQDKDYFWDRLVGQDDGFVTALIVAGDPVVVTVMDSQNGDYDSYDDNQEVFVVIAVGTQYFKQLGRYASHSGYEWDGHFREVKPMAKVVTVFE